MKLSASIPCTKGIFLALSCLVAGGALFSFWEPVRLWLSEALAMYLQDGRYLWLIEGLGTTLLLSCLAMILGIGIALLISMIRFLKQAGYPVGALNRICSLYITVIRGTPVTIQLLILYFGVFAAVDVQPILAASLAFGINSGAYVAEIFRSGIEAVDPGQMEAGLALGLSYGQTFRKILLPQAVKTILPTLFNEWIALIKETAIAGYVGVTDLTRAANDIRSKTWSQSPLLVSALLYLALVLLFTAGLHRLERRLKRSDRR